MIETQATPAMPSWGSIAKGGALVAAGGAGTAIAAGMDPAAVLPLVERVGLPTVLLLLGLRWAAGVAERAATFAAPKVEQAAASFSLLASSQERLTAAMGSYGTRLDEAVDQGQHDHQAILDAVHDGGAHLTAVVESAKVAALRAAESADRAATEASRAATEAHRAAVAAESLQSVIGAAALDRIVHAADPREGRAA